VTAASAGRPLASRRVIIGRAVAMAIGVDGQGRLRATAADPADLEPAR
jgi:hypothetical protein